MSDDAARISLGVEGDEAGGRLDRFLAGRLPALSRTRLQALTHSGRVLVNGRPGRASQRLASGDRIEVALPQEAPSGTVAPAPEAIPLHVLYEDDDLLVVDKAAGIVVHPAPGHASGTLVNALLAHTPQLSRMGGEQRPGIVHRLDRDTSGLMVVAKHDQAQRLLARQLRQREMDKRYLALVDGAPVPPRSGSLAGARSTRAGAPLIESGTVEAPLGRHPQRSRPMAIVPEGEGGRPSLTHFAVLRRYARHTLLECRPVTGRTHQIRVHLAAIGAPVVGDRVYGRRPPSLDLDRHFLHAARLTFRLPDGTRRTFEAPLPEDLAETLRSLET
ncbi:MAG TPA: RluA family pseudouridine synthase [Chloroflexota bacterium]|nr:RluA family pseudouridine synthase [Chloroflexota bacterium]